MYKVAAIIMAKGCQSEEWIVPYHWLKGAGWKVQIAAVDWHGEEVLDKYGIKVPVHCSTEKLLEHDKHLDLYHDLVIIPGGWQMPEIARQDSNVLECIRWMDKQKKIVAAVCHGPQVLISSNILKGRKCTAYKGIKHDIINAGATYVDGEVVVDGNLVTSPHYNFMGVFMRETLKAYELYCLANYVGH